MSWFLENAFERNKEVPSAFYIPSPQEIEKLKVGDFVKVGFLPEEGDHGRERIWLKITKRHGQKFLGALCNNPIAFSDLKLGEEISFGVENILATEYDAQL